MQRLGQVVALHLAAVASNTVTIVDPAVVAHHAGAVQDKRLRCVSGSEQVRHLLAGIEQDGKRQFALPGMAGHVLGSVLTVTVDGKELDASGRELAMQLRQAEDVPVDERTLRADERNDNGLFLAKIGERHSLARGVFEVEGTDRVWWLLRWFPFGGPGWRSAEKGQDHRGDKELNAKRHAAAPEKRMRSFRAPADSCQPR
jgi:hypothetical protein